MLLLARTSLFALTTGTRALRTSSVPRMTAQVPRPNLGSASESEASDVEVVLPRARKKPSPEELQYRRAMTKMFEYV